MSEIEQNVMLVLLDVLKKEKDDAQESEDSL